MIFFERRGTLLLLLVSCYIAVTRSEAENILKPFEFRRQYRGPNPGVHVLGSSDQSHVVGQIGVSSGFSFNGQNLGPFSRVADMTSAPVTLGTSHVITGPSSVNRGPAPFAEPEVINGRWVGANRGPSPPSPVPYMMPNELSGSSMSPVLQVKFASPELVEGPWLRTPADLEAPHYTASPELVVGPWISGPQSSHDSKLKSSESQRLSDKSEHHAVVVAGSQSLRYTVVPQITSSLSPVQDQTIAISNEFFTTTESYQIPATESLLEQASESTNQLIGSESMSSIINSTEQFSSAGNKENHRIDPKGEIHNMTPPVIDIIDHGITETANSHISSEAHVNDHRNKLSASIGNDNVANEDTLLPGIDVYPQSITSPVKLDSNIDLNSTSSTLNLVGVAADEKSALDNDLPATINSHANSLVTVNMQSTSELSKLSQNAESKGSYSKYGGQIDRKDVFSVPSAISIIPGPSLGPAHETKVERAVAEGRSPAVSPHRLPYDKPLFDVPGQELSNDQSSLHSVDQIYGRETHDVQYFVGEKAQKISELADDLSHPTKPDIPFVSPSHLLNNTNALLPPIIVPGQSKNVREDSIQASSFHASDSDSSNDFAPMTVLGYFGNFKTHKNSISYQDKTNSLNKTEAVNYNMSKQMENSPSVYNLENLEVPTNSALRYDDVDSPLTRANIDHNNSDLHTKHTFKVTELSPVFVHHLQDDERSNYTETSSSDILIFSDKEKEILSDTGNYHKDHLLPDGYYRSKEPRVKIVPIIPITTAHKTASVETVKVDNHYGIPYITPDTSPELPYQDSFVLGMLPPPALILPTEFQDHPINNLFPKNQPISNHQVTPNFLLQQSGFPGNYQPAHKPEAGQPLNYRSKPYLSGAKIHQLVRTQPETQQLDAYRKPEIHQPLNIQSTNYQSYSHNGGIDETDNSAIQVTKLKPQTVHLLERKNLKQIPLSGALTPIPGIDQSNIILASLASPVFNSQQTLSHSLGTSAMSHKPVSFPQKSYVPHVHLTIPVESVPHLPVEYEEKHQKMLSLSDEHETSEPEENVLKALTPTSLPRSPVSSTRHPPSSTRRPFLKNPLTSLLGSFNIYDLIPKLPGVTSPKSSTQSSEKQNYVGMIDNEISDNRRMDVVEESSNEFNPIQTNQESHMDNVYAESKNHFIKTFSSSVKYSATPLNGGENNFTHHTSDRTNSKRMDNLSDGESSRVEPLALSISGESSERRVVLALPSGEDITESYSSVNGEQINSRLNENLLGSSEGFNEARTHAPITDVSDVGESGNKMHYKDDATHQHSYEAAGTDRLEAWTPSHHNRSCWAFSRKELVINPQADAFIGE